MFVFKLFCGSAPAPIKSAPTVSGSSPATLWAVADEKHNFAKKFESFHFFGIRTEYRYLFSIYLYFFERKFSPLS